MGAKISIGLFDWSCKSIGVLISLYRLVQILNGDHHLRYAAEIRRARLARRIRSLGPLSDVVNKKREECAARIGADLCHLPLELNSVGAPAPAAGRVAD